jgi:hypothetical protein
VHLISIEEYFKRHTKVDLSKVKFKEQVASIVNNINRAKAGVISLPQMTIS